MKPHQPLHLACVLALFHLPLQAAAPLPPQMKLEAASLVPPGLPAYAGQILLPGSDLGHASAAGDDKAGNSAQTGSGLLPCVGVCNQPVASQRALIDANMDRAHVRAFARGSIKGQTGATFTLHDSISLDPSNAMLSLHVDTPRFSTLGAGSEARFYTALWAHDGADYSIPLFILGLVQTATVGGSMIDGYLVANGTFTPLSAVPEQTDFELAVPPGHELLNLKWEVSAGVTAFDGGLAEVWAANSVYMGIQGGYTSQGGYQYLGYTAAVPEPAALLLLAIGLAGLLSHQSARCARKQAREEQS